MAATTTAPQPPQAAEAPAAEPGIRLGHGAVLRAIEQNIQDNSVSVQVAGLGTVRLPALDSLAWIGGLAALAALDILEWPVAAAIGVGHVLARQQHLRLLKGFGEALEEA